VNGVVSFFGDSSWHLIETIESFNGMRSGYGSGHSTCVDWFSQDAFGGSNYTNTPVGAVCHTSEPGLSGVSSGTVYFGYWERGKYFAICAWESGSPCALLIIGDPLVVR
jgi:hypothetical protein